MGEIKKLFIAIILLITFLGCSDSPDKCIVAANELAISSFEYGYTTCKANIPREQARKELEKVLYIIDANDTKKDTRIIDIDIKPSYTYRFSGIEDHPIAILSFDSNKLEFSGNATKAAYMFAERYPNLLKKEGPINYTYNSFYFSNKENKTISITFTENGVKYEGDLAVSKEADQFFKCVLEELIKNNGE